MMTDTMMQGRRIVFTIVALLMLGASSMTLAGDVRAQGTGTPPTVGAIVVDSYDCDTGELRFRVPVTDLPYIPDSNGSLGFETTGRYDLGPDFSRPVIGFNPQPEIAPYTGEVSLARTIPLINDATPDPPGPSGFLASIDISVFVGDGVNPGDTSTLSHAVDCGDEGDIVDQLIAILVRILQDILGE